MVQFGGISGLLILLQVLSTPELLFKSPRCFTSPKFYFIFFLAAQSSQLFHIFKLFQVPKLLQCSSSTTTFHLPSSSDPWISREEAGKREGGEREARHWRKEFVGG